MNSVVIDASFAASWFIPDESNDSATAVLQEIVHGSIAMAVPSIWTYEMCNVLQSALRRQRITDADAAEAMDLLHRIPGQTFDHHERLFRSRLMILARRFDLSAYDAAYLELADRLQCPLHTNDAVLRNAAKTLGLLD